jgi:hypothetical protein
MQGRGWQRNGQRVVVFSIHRVFLVLKTVLDKETV